MCALSLLFSSLSSTKYAGSSLPGRRPHHYKTSQSTSPISIAKETFKTKGVRGFYPGCGALVTGNAVKAAVRFFSYDQFKKVLVNNEVSRWSGDGGSSR